MDKKLYIITGVNGIGKSSAIPEIAKSLYPESYSIHDFDERRQSLEKKPKRMISTL